jgi:hypothetical protein
MKRIGGVTEKITKRRRIENQFTRNQQHRSSHYGIDVIALNGGAGDLLAHRTKGRRIVVPKKLRNGYEMVTKWLRNGYEMIRR